MSSQRKQVYLDHQSGTPALPEVVEAMLPFLQESCGNPASPHRHALTARRALKQAREQAAALMGAESPEEEIVFTSGGTEACNLGVRGAALANSRRGRHIVLTAIEHPAVLRTAEALEREGFTIGKVPVSDVGGVEPGAVEAALTDETCLVCVHHANHDIGTVQPLAAIAALLQERGLPLFVDATFSGGWLPIDVGALGISYLALAPHRFQGPKGAGILYRSRRARLVPILSGGEQEGGLRPGTENVPAIVGAGVACEKAEKNREPWAAEVSALQQRLWSGLEDVVDARLNGPPPGPDRLCTNLNLSFPGVEGEGLALRCDMRGVSFTSGSGCVIRSLRMPHVLEAIGVSRELSIGTILLSPGLGQVEADMDYAAETIAEAVEFLREMGPGVAN